MCTEMKAPPKPKCSVANALVRMEITPSDILCGRGKAFFNHVGNKKFRETIVNALPMFLQARDLNDRRRVIDGLVRGVRLSGARFLRADHATGKCSELTGPEAIEKVGRALRDAESDLFSTRKRKPHRIMQQGGADSKPGSPVSDMSSVSTGSRWYIVPTQTPPMASNEWSDNYSNDQLAGKLAASAFQLAVAAEVAQPVAPRALPSTFLSQLYTPRTETSPVTHDEMVIGSGGYEANQAHLKVGGPAYLPSRPQMELVTFANSSPSPSKSRSMCNHVMDDDLDFIAKINEVLGPMDHDSCCPFPSF